MKVLSYISKVIKVALITCVLILIAIVYCNVRIQGYAKSRTFDNVEEIPRKHAALLLGTAPTVRNGNPNKYFVYRIDACVKLYNAGKIDKIIVSGDNHHKSYNEPEAMRRALIDRGVSDSDIFRDYAGFRTLDSVVRAKEIFGQASYIIVSQKFHNERAVFIAKWKGIDAIGFNARDAGIKFGIKTRIREVFARCKVYFDLMIGKQPHFLGESIDIG